MIKNIFESLAQSNPLRRSKVDVAAIFEEFQLLPLAKAQTHISLWEADGQHERTDRFIGELSRALALANDAEIPDHEALTRFLRAVPAIIVDRRRAVSASLVLCANDKEAKDLVRSADYARDQRDWAGGEYAYWRVISLYPLHPGYHVQYGHCLKEQSKYADAEINYRAAFALGDVKGDLVEHIAFVAARRNQTVGNSTLTRIADFWRGRTTGGALDVPPTGEDITAVYKLFLGRGPASLDEVVSVLSASASLRDVLGIIFSKPDFMTANRHLLAYLVESGWQK